MKDVLTESYYKKYLTKEEWKEFKLYKNTHEFIDEINNDLLEKICNIQAKWAIKKGADTFILFFLPFTEKISGKFVSIYCNSNKGKKYNLNANNLKKTECDASSFPNGGVRHTCEAKGFIKWNIHSDLFICTYSDKKVLYIPGIFSSYNGVALDNTEVLLRCKKTLNKVISENMKLIGNTAKKCISILEWNKNIFYLKPVKLI